MCLILFAWKSHPHYPLVVAANRDEFFDRPTLAAHFWKEAPDILAGRDLRKGGSWLGIQRNGKFAAVTNFRGAAPVPDKRSRGELVAGFLLQGSAPSSYLDQLLAQGSQYNAFNLLLGDDNELCYFADDENQWRSLPPGIYGLGNGRLDSDTAKVHEGKQALRKVLYEGISIESLLAMLSDTEQHPEAPAADNELELGLSARFIKLPGYGTRASTVILKDDAGNIEFVERSFEEGGAAGQTVRFALKAAEVHAAAD